MYYITLNTLNAVLLMLTCILMSSEVGTNTIIMYITFKTMADLKRTLPAIVLFWIPLVGYVAPFLA